MIYDVIRVNVWIFKDEKISKEVLFVETSSIVEKKIRIYIS
jgi:hypothetical protein